VDFLELLLELDVLWAELDALPVTQRRSTETLTVSGGGLCSVSWALGWATVHLAPPRIGQILMLNAQNSLSAGTPPQNRWENLQHPQALYLYLRGLLLKRRRGKEGRGNGGKGKVKGREGKGRKGGGSDLVHLKKI